MGIRVSHQVSESHFDVVRELHLAIAVGSEVWDDDAFRTQTGQNINVAANGIAKLLRMMIEEDDGTR